MTRQIAEALNNNFIALSTFARRLLIGGHRKYIFFIFLSFELSEQTFKLWIFCLVSQNVTYLAKATFVALREKRSEKYVPNIGFNLIVCVLALIFLIIVMSFSAHDNTFIRSSEHLYLSLMY